MAKKAVVVFSGGPDSTAAALWAMQAEFDVELLTFQFRNKEQYGELKASYDVASYLGLPHSIFDFRSPMQHFPSHVHPLMHSGTKTGDIDTKESHRLSFGAGMVLSTACNYALYNKIYTVIWGATKDDAGGGRFDYTQEFCNLLAMAVSKSTQEDFAIIAPFSTLHKHQVMQSFVGKEGLFAMTWSCKMGGLVQSGNCHASIARRVAARIAGVRDMTVYDTKDIDWPLSEDKLADISKISEDELVHIFQSEKAPQFT